MPTKYSILSTLPYLLALVCSKTIVVHTQQSPLVQLPPVTAACSCTGNLYTPTLQQDTRNSLTEIVLTGFFSFRSCDSEQRGPNSTYHLIPAALLALEEINNSSEILNGYHLSLDVRDTQCSPTRTQFELANSIQFHTKNSSSMNLGIVGPGCSPKESEAIAGVTGRFAYIPSVSYGYNSPRLGDKERFPSFFQTARTIDLTIRSALGVLDFFNWTNNLALIYEATDAYILTIEDIVRPSLDSPSGFDIISSDPSVDIPITYFTQVSLGASESENRILEEFMRDVRSSNIRVVLGLLSEQVALNLLCTARNGVIPGEGFVYVFVGTYSDNWWRQHTPTCNLTDSDLESVLVVSSESINSNSSAVLQSGIVLHDFKVGYSQRLREWCPSESGIPDPRAGTTYDAVWSLALALDSTLDTLNDSVDYEYNREFHQRVTEALNNTDFSGASGTVQFDSRGEREGADSVFQIQSGNRVLVARYDLNEGGLSDKSPFVWWESNETPQDMPTHLEKFVPIPYLVIATVFTLAGIVFACFMWYFNWKYSTHKILRASSQKLNYIIIVGVVLGYISVLILTVLESPLGQAMGAMAFKALCVIRVSILPIAFSLSYGTMFARAWRIYRIFNNPWISNRPLKDQNLLLIVAVIIIGDILILVPWTIVDPYRQFPTPDDVNYDEFTVCVYSSCSSENVIIWLGVLSAYKLTIIFTGSFVISLVRKRVQEKKIFNDSQALAVALYVSALAFVIGLGLTLFFILRFQVVLAYIVSSVWVNISSSGTLICVFLPKLYRIRIKHEAGKKYKSAKSVFYLEHPSIAHELSSSVSTPGSIRRTSTREPYVHPGFGNITITEQTLQTIQGTEDSPQMNGFHTTECDYEESIQKVTDDHEDFSESLRNEYKVNHGKPQGRKFYKEKSVTFGTDV